MLKLTLAEWGMPTEWEYQREGPIWINPSMVTHVCPHPAGSYVHFTHHGHFVKESAEEVARMMDEAKIPGLLKASGELDFDGVLNRYLGTNYEGLAPAPDNPYGARVVPPGTGLDGKSLVVEPDAELPRCF